MSSQDVARRAAGLHPKRAMRPSLSLKDARADLRPSPAGGTDEPKGDPGVADLIAIGYPDETTAIAAQQEAERLAHDLVIQPDAIAAIVRHRDGKFKVHSTAHPVTGGTMYGMFWGLLFGLLFFVPIFGMAVGAGLGALMGKIEKSGVDREFQKQVQDMLQPGTSALFMVVEKVTPDKAVDALSRFGGTVLKTSLSKEAEAELQAELGGTSDKEFAGTSV
jgi:uncharacterized membrane protein